MVLDPTERWLYITEEWPHRIVRWDTRSSSHVAEVVVAPHETTTGMAGPEGVAVHANGDIFWSEYGAFGGNAPDPAGRGHVEGVAVKPGQVMVKRAATGSVELVASGFWRCRGIALHEQTLYVANEANAWDQGSSGAIHAVDVATGATRLLLSGLDYPQFPAVDPAGVLFFSLALHNKFVSYDPSDPDGGFAACAAPALAAMGIHASTRGFTWLDPASSERTPTAGGGDGGRLSLAVEGMTPAAISGAVQLPGSGGELMAWLRVPREQVDTDKRELPYNE